MDQRKFVMRMRFGAPSGEGLTEHGTDVGQDREDVHNGKGGRCSARTGWRNHKTLRAEGIQVGGSQVSESETCFGC